MRKRKRQLKYGDNSGEDRKHLFPRNSTGFSHYCTNRKIKVFGVVGVSGDTIRIQTQLLMEQTMNDDLSFNIRTPKNVAHIKGNTTHGFRDMPLTPNAKRILKQIRKFNPRGQYILMHDGKQLSTVTFNRYLRQYCKEAGVPYKSSHKIRFTVASLLYKNGVSAYI